MAPFYGWDLTPSRLESLQGGSLLFTTKFPEIPGTHFIDLGRMKGWVNQVVLNTGPLDWESSTLTTSKYSCVSSLKDKKGITIAFQSFLDSPKKKKPNKIWVDQGS